MSKRSVSVDLARCPQNHACPMLRVCPAGAISQTGFAAPSIDSEKCIACGRCISLCPMRAMAFG